MALSLFLSILFLLLGGSASSLSASPKTLVIVKDTYSKYTYSRFFKSLKRRGHALTIKSASDKSIKLLEYGEPLFSNLILLSPSSSSLGDISYRDILSFMDKGNNVMVGLGPNYSTDLTKKLADRCGIEVHSAASSVRDHANYDLLRADDHFTNDVILLDAFPALDALFRSDAEMPSAPVLFRGLGMSVKRKAHLALSLLPGNAETYSVDPALGPMEKSVLAAGNDLSLIAALQMRNGARVTFLGSMPMLSDEFWISAVQSAKDSVRFDKSGNEALMSSVSAWAFGERGVLRISNSSHRQLRSADGGAVTVNPTGYRIKDEVRFETVIEEYVMACDCWRPFTRDDVQFELVRLDPFIRQTMTHNGEGRYEIEFVLPDVFGVYKLRVRYQRKGWGYLDSEMQVSVRPYRHDEYERFLPTAYPYYLGAASMIVGFIGFTFVFLFGTAGSKNERIWK